MKQFYAQILPSGRKATLYVGVTSDLEQSIHENTEALFATRGDRRSKEWRRSQRFVFIDEANLERKNIAERLYGWIPNQVRDDGSRVAK